jgi:glycosyltransferase involved in cell wall biosynthesis
MMRVTVIVATYGAREWALRGAETAKSVQGASQVIALHLDTGTLAQARNAAAVGATSEWLCFLDADDRLDADFVQSMQVAWALLQPAASEPLIAPQLLVPSVSFVTGDRCSPPVIPAWDRNVYDVNCAVIGTLIPRALFDRVRGFGEWDAYEDWELWLRCITHGARLFPVPPAIYCARAEDGTGRNTAADHSETYRRIRDLYATVPAAVWREAKAR